MTFLAIICFAHNFKEINGEVLFKYQPRTWYEDKLANLPSISESGRYIAFHKEGELWIHDRETKNTKSIREITGFSKVYVWNWLKGNMIDLKGHLKDKLERKAFNLTDHTWHETPVERNGFSRLTAGDTQIIWAFRKETKWGLYVDYNGESAKIVDKPPMAYALSPDGAQVAYLLTNEDGWTDLIIYNVKKQSSDTVAKNLDCGYLSSSMVFHKNGEVLFVSLAGTDKTQKSEKHKPQTGRNLDIYKFDIAKKTFSKHCASPHDDAIITFADNKLIIETVETDMHATVFQGEKAILLTEKTSSYPYWHPSENKLSFMFGEWNLADWALNWDIAVVDFDRQFNLQNEKILIEGLHEDFNAAWSHSGEWLAYHTHRSTEAVTSYRGEGSKDAIFIRKAAGGEEYQVSAEDRFEVLQAEWSPDDQKLVYCAMSPKKPFDAFLVELDLSQPKGLTDKVFRPEAIKGAIFGANWNEDGSALFLEEAGESEHHIWRAPLDGSEPEKLLSFPSKIEFGGLDFDPKNKLIYFSALKDGHHQIATLNLENKAVTYLTNSDFEHSSPQVSPDGKLFASTRYRHQKSIIAIDP